MSVGSGVPYNAHTGNGLSTVFAYGFTLLAAADLVVTIDGVVTSAYTVSGIGVAAGGSITFSAAPANGAAVLLQRVIQLVRSTEYQNNGDLQAETVNDDFDRLWMAVQNVNSDSSRALRVPELEVFPDLPTAAARASKLLGFDAGGNVAVVTPDSQDAAALALSLASAGASTGAAQVGFLPGGTGAVPSNLQIIIRRRVCVEDRGADPDGALSSNTAFDNSAAELLAQGGGDLYVGPGEFLLLNWVQPAGIRLTGAGRGRTLLRKNGGAGGTHVIRAAGSDRKSVV